MTLKKQTALFLCPYRTEPSVLSNLQFVFTTMQKIENAVVDVATGKKMYVPPQIEVVELVKHSPLLSASYPAGAGAGMNEIEEDTW